MVAHASVHELSAGPGPGGYGLVRVLGRGASGEVWEACSPVSDERLALKFLDLGGMSAKQRDFAFQEARLMRRLSHPHVVRFVDLIVESSRMCIVMQYMAGGDMRRLVGRMRDSGELFKEVDLWRWLLQIASALQYLHQARILHRDVKSANIFLSDNCLPGHAAEVEFAKSAVLGDLGIAKVLASAEARTATQIGTPAYLAPEVWQGRCYSYAADVFSFGCTVYELAELRMPFAAENRVLLGEKVCKRHCLPIRGGEGGYTPTLQRLVQLMMDKDAAARPSPRDILLYARRIATSVGSGTEGANAIDIRSPSAALRADGVGCGPSQTCSAQQRDATASASRHITTPRPRLRDPVICSGSRFATPARDAAVERIVKAEAVVTGGCEGVAVCHEIADSVDHCAGADGGDIGVYVGRLHAEVVGMCRSARNTTSQAPRHGTSPRAAAKVEVCTHGDSGEGDAVSEVVGTPNATVESADHSDAGLAIDGGTPSFVSHRTKVNDCVPPRFIPVDVAMAPVRDAVKSLGRNCASAFCASAAINPVRAVAAGIGPVSRRGRVVGADARAEALWLRLLRGRAGSPPGSQEKTSPQRQANSPMPRRRLSSPPPRISPSAPRVGSPQCFSPPSPRPLCRANPPPPARRQPSLLVQPRRCISPLPRGATPRGSTSAAPPLSTRRSSSPPSARVAVQAKGPTRPTSARVKVQLSPSPLRLPPSPPPRSSPRRQRLPPGVQVLSEDMHVQHQLPSADETLLPSALHTPRGWGKIVPWRDRVDVSCFQGELSFLSTKDRLPRDSGSRSGDGTRLFISHLTAAGSGGA
eukprot:TRINITY_DN5601_c0_g1_i1.p1 TRINITY_DN5601_c0_g1~~TRINITY_DN5601_c0_g1_i1.p1  ORF type:complete len:836 (-),score=105.48 TRINITY_DN5601_c0_g1_i1:71-2509(-)